MLKWGAERLNITSLEPIRLSSPSSVFHSSQPSLDSKIQGYGDRAPCPPPLSLFLSSVLMNGALRVDFNYCSVEVGIGHALNWNETHFSSQQGREENGG